MKVILVHGDHTTKIADRINKFVDVARKRNWKIERLGSSDTNLREILTAVSLFDEERFFILEDFQKIKKSDWEWLKKSSKKITGNLIIVSFKLLTKTQISLFPTPDKIEVFDLPKAIWAFFDSFYPGNGTRSLALLHEVLEKDAVELVYALLARHLKDLYLSKIDSGNFNIPPWRIKKLGEQSKKFTLSGLKKVILYLARADYNSKTGKGDLVSSLDFLIALELE